MLVNHFRTASLTIIITIVNLILVNICLRLVVVECNHNHYRQPSSSSLSSSQYKSNNEFENVDNQFEDGHQTNQATTALHNHQSIISTVDHLLQPPTTNRKYQNQQQQQHSSLTSSTHIKQPSFGEPDAESNYKQVVVGRSVRLKCVVNDIGNHKVSWFHKDKRVLIAIDNKVIMWRDRVKVSSHADSVFFLHFDPVQLSDKVSSWLLVSLVGHLLFRICSLPVQFFSRSKLF